jgi:hypothetical protein
MRWSVVEEDVASGARTFRVPRPLISGAQFYMGDMSLMKLQVHDLVLYRALCPLDPGFPEICARTGATGYPIRLPNLGNQVSWTGWALTILMGSDKLIFLELFWPGRVDPMSLVFGLGLTPEKANILPNIRYGQNFF